jgi:hypothetical protein
VPPLGRQPARREPAARQPQLLKLTVVAGYYAVYYTEGPSISQMRLSQLDGRARYSPEYTYIDMTFDPNSPFSLD